jgi:methyl-accepting chemotaxis protein
MRYFRNLKVSTKLVVSFTLITLAFGFAIFVGFLSMRTIHLDLDAMYSDRTLAVERLGQINVGVFHLGEVLHKYVLIPAPNAAASAPAASPSASAAGAAGDCSTCHADKVDNAAHTGGMAKSGEKLECQRCHPGQAGDAQHGTQAAQGEAAGQAAAQAGRECSSCHSEQLVASQRDDVQQGILGQMEAISGLVEEYRQGSLTSQEREELKKFDKVWEAQQAVVRQVLAQANRGEERQSVHRVVGGDAMINQQALEGAASRLIQTNQQLAKESNANAQLTYTKASWTLIIVGSLGLFLAIFLGILVTTSITRPLKDLRTTAQAIAGQDLPDLAGGIARMAQGDLTGSVQLQAAELQVSAHDDLGRLAQDFNAMILRLHEVGVSFTAMTTGLRRLVGEVQQNAAELGHASGQLTGIAHQAGQATAQISQTVQQVAQGAAQQSNSISQAVVSYENMAHLIPGIARGAQEQALVISRTASAMSQLSTSLSGIQRGAEQQAQQMQAADAVRLSVQQALGQLNQAAGQVLQQSQRTSQAAQDGAGSARQTESGMERVRQTTADLARRVSDLGKRSAQIGMILETIDGIAAQTNLLALNAAIEAARAGVHGRSFAVVADEVRKLAEHSAQATREIAGMIELVQSGAAEVAEAMQRAGQDVATAAGLAGELRQSFDLIARSAQDSSTQVQEINHLLHSVEQAEAQFDQVIHQAGSMAQANLQSAQAMAGLNAAVVSNLEQVSGVVDQNAASAEEMEASSHEVAQQVENIASISEENSAATEQVSGSVEGLSAQVQEVSASSRALADMAGSLKQAVSRFRL